MVARYHDGAMTGTRHPFFEWSGRRRRPDVDTVKAAISQSRSMSEAALLLKCSRTALYEWVRHYGLERFAGVRSRTLDELNRLYRDDTGYTQDSEDRKENKKGVRTVQEFASTVASVQAEMATERLTQITVRIPQGVWDEAKIQAIRRRCRLAEYVTVALERANSEEDEPPSETAPPDEPHVPKGKRK